MKKVYIPSMDELYKMQDVGVNVYRYLVAKVAESMLCDGVQSIRGILSANSLTNIIDLKEYLDIVKAICLMYPKEFDNLMRISENNTKIDTMTNLLTSDVNFCLKCLDARTINVDSNKLDCISYFDNSVASNGLVLKKVLLLLNEELARNPKYRFEYLSGNRNNSLLDDIFGCKIGDNELMLMIGSSRDETIKALTTIEPAYAVILPNNYFRGYLGVCDDKTAIKDQLYNGINSYANRYNIDSSIGSHYYGKDILTNPDSEVKKLMKCIKR